MLVKLKTYMSIGELGRLFSVGIVCFALGLLSGLYINSLI